MSVSEKINAEEMPYALTTRLPNVLLREITPSDLVKLKSLFEKNFHFFAQGGIIADALYDMIEDEKTINPVSERHRMGIWQNDTLVGYISVCPYDEAVEDNEVEVSYAIGQDHIGQGLSSAALEAVVEYENAKGNSVIAEVELRNEGSMRLLGKLGFEQAYNRPYVGRNIFVRTDLSFREMMRRLGI